MVDRTQLDADGQPRNRSFNASRNMDRSIAELLGLAKGFLADGVVTKEESKYLFSWIEANPDITGCWPGDALWRRMNRIYADGMATDDERGDLVSLLQGLVGGETGIIVGANASTALPLDTPPPTIIYPGRLFVLTGEFAFAPRDVCEAVIEKAGGRIRSSVTLETSYLILGTFASRDWIHTSFGRKIEKAVRYRDEKRRPIAIIGEDHWAATLP